MDLLHPFERLLDANTGAVLPALEEAGYLDALRDLPLIEVEPLIRALGRRGIAEPVAETMATRAVPDPSRALCAVLASVEIAGLSERLLEMSVDHARQRVQFGKPIGSFQAIQQQLAVMAEQVVLVRAAGQAACAAGLHPSPEQAAVAKSVASAAVPVITGIAHAAHGAIGITAEFPLAGLTARLHRLRMAHGSESWWSAVLGTTRLEASGNSLDFVRSLQPTMP
jgi:acyl-CoA dehydrogenase